MEILSENQIKVENILQKCIKREEVEDGALFIAAKTNEIHQNFLQEEYGIAPNSEFRLLVSGSTALGTNVRGSDIDLCALLPSQMTQRVFYGSYRAKMVEEMKPERSTKNENFVVHILKFVIDGVKVDIIGAFFIEFMMCW